MIRISFQTRLIVHRQPPTTVPLRTGHKIYVICAPAPISQLPVSTCQPVAPAQRSWASLTHNSQTHYRHSPG